MESPTSGKILGKSLSLLWSVKFCSNVEQGDREKRRLDKAALATAPAFRGERSATFEMERR